jgi:hypothetical protein
MRARGIRLAIADLCLTPYLISVVPAMRRFREHKAEPVTDTYPREFEQVAFIKNLEEIIR